MKSPVLFYYGCDELLMGSHFTHWSYLPTHNNWARWLHKQKHPMLTLRAKAPIMLLNSLACYLMANGKQNRQYWTCLLVLTVFLSVSALSQANLILNQQFVLFCLCNLHKSRWMVKSAGHQFYFKLVFGRIWMSTSDLRGGNKTFEITLTTV